MEDAMAYLTPYSRGRSAVWTTFCAGFIALVACGRDNGPEPSVQDKRSRSTELSSNEAAFAEVAPRLDEIAFNYGLTGDRLASLSKSDKHLRVDKGGRLYYACPSLDEASAVTGNDPHAASMASGLQLTVSVADADPTDLTQFLKLHSRPGASKVLLLDFTGHITTGTSWNAGFGSELVTPPYDTDGNRAAFSDAEKRAIISIWRAVAEDFAAFDLDVTTEETDAAGAPISLSGRGARAAIGGSSWDWLQASAGGIAYVGVFGNDYYGPAFVFSDQLGGGHSKYVWEAISHEIGHNLGLSHDGSSTQAYYAGHNGWAPIMGVGYYHNTSQFSKGEYPDANNQQDDLAIISRYVPYIADDYGSTATAAQILAATPSPADSNRDLSLALGSIARSAESDWFAISAGAGNATFELTLLPNAAGGEQRTDLDLGLAIYAADGVTRLAAFDPQGGILTGSKSVTLPSAGRYYVALTGVGDGTVGYSSYGSLGQYRVKVDYPRHETAVTNQPPTAKATASVTQGTVPLTVTFSSAGSVDPDGTIASYKWTFSDGTTSTEPTPAKTINTAGTLTATLIVTDNGGLSTSASAQVTATNPTTSNAAPVAAASANVTSGRAPLAVNFSSFGSHDSDGAIVSYFWSFGDGTTSIEPSPTKVYSSRGTYNATLTITDNGGLTDTARVTINVTQNRKKR